MRLRLWLWRLRFQGWLWIWWERFRSWLKPFPDVTVTLNRYDTPFNTRVSYYHIDLDLGIEIIRIHTVELNLFIPEDLVPDDEILSVSSTGAGTHDVDLIDFVLYGIKWESTLQAVTRRMGLDVATDLDNWVMWGDYKTVTGEDFPFFDMPTGQIILSPEASVHSPGDA